MKLSDVAVASPDVQRVRAIEQLPIVKERDVSRLGRVSGRERQAVTEFRVTGVFGSLDGRFFDRDIATVVHGRLPRLDSTTEVALSAPSPRGSASAWATTSSTSSTSRLHAP